MSNRERSSSQEWPEPERGRYQAPLDEAGHSEAGGGYRDASRGDNGYSGAGSGYPPSGYAAAGPTGAGYGDAGGPDHGGPDFGGPDFGGPDYGGPDYGGPGAPVGGGLDAAGRPAPGYGGTGSGSPGNGSGEAGYPAGYSSAGRRDAGHPGYGDVGQAGYGDVGHAGYGDVGYGAQPPGPYQVPPAPAADPYQVGGYPEENRPGGLFREDPYVPGQYRPPAGAVRYDQSPPEPGRHDPARRDPARHDPSEHDPSGHDAGRYGSAADETAQFPAPDYDAPPPAGFGQPEAPPSYPTPPGYQAQPAEHTQFMQPVPPGQVGPESGLPGAHLIGPAPGNPVTPPPEPVLPGRAGRNLPAAIGVGAGLGALVVVSLYLYPIAFLGLAVVAIMLAVWELAHALATQGIKPPLVPILIGSAAMLIGAYADGAQALAVASALTVLGILVWRLPDGADGYLRDMTAGVFAALYVPFLAAFAILMLTAPHDGPRRVTAFILLTVCSDIGGYAAGVLFGRHKMAPTISPKKTWEGFAGSVLACTLVGAVAVHTLLHGAWWQGVVVGLAIVLTATLGDLVESVIKRDLGIKDMGTLLPGHGGLMDRLDSLLPTAPVVWLLLLVLVQPG